MEKVINGVILFSFDFLGEGVFEFSPFFFFLHMGFLFLLGGKRFKKKNFLPLF